MGSVSHLRQSMSLRDLDSIADEVYAELDRMCLRVGALLVEARDTHPVEFRAWVEEKMPFTYDTASRLIAIHLAYAHLPPEKVAQLPRAWQALFALRHHAMSGRLEAALESGEVGPDTTREQARAKTREWSNRQGTGLTAEPRYSPADYVAGRLMNYHAVELDPIIAEALAEWLNQRSDLGATRP